MSRELTTLSQLESHLWESANILRGPVDAADFKTYIFPLLFFKRICDVWDEEYARASSTRPATSELAWLPGVHRFQIPEGCHWSDVRAKAEQRRRGAPARDARDRAGQPGHPLRRLRRRPLGEQGAALRRAAQGSDRALLASCRSATRPSASDVLGDAYEYLIKKFADATNKKAGEFYTPRSVVRLMVEHPRPEGRRDHLRPGLRHRRHAARRHRSTSTRRTAATVRRLWGKLYGQEKNLTTSSIARMNLVLHGIEDFQIVRGDTLRNPAFTDRRPASPPSTA